MTTRVCSNCNAEVESKMFFEEDELKCPFDNKQGSFACKHLFYNECIIDLHIEEINNCPKCNETIRTWLSGRFRLLKNCKANTIIILLKFKIKEKNNQIKELKKLSKLDLGSVLDFTVRKYV